VPPDLTTPSTSYRVRVLVVLSSLFLFASLYLGLVVGSAYLCYQCFAALVAPAQQLPARLSALEDAFRTEERVGRIYNDAVRQGQQHQMSDGRFLQTLEQDVLPPWRAALQRLGQVKGLSGEEQRLVDQYRQALQLQEESWVLLCRAIRQNDRGLAQQAQQKAQQSEALGRQFSADASRYFSRLPPPERHLGGWNIIAGILCGLLCLFLVKGFFKWRRADRAQRLEVTETS
jgi:hypothetical protein